MDVPCCTYFLSYAVSDTMGSNTMVIGKVISCLSGTFNKGPIYWTGSVVELVLESVGNGMCIVASAI